MAKAKNPELAVSARVLRAVETLPENRRAPLLEYLAQQMRDQAALGIPKPKDPRQAVIRTQNGAVDPLDAG